MSISRRNFLRTGSMVVLGVAATQSQLAKTVVGQKPGREVNSVTGFRVPTASMDDPLTYYTKATFEAHLNSTFRLRQRDSVWSTTLVKVIDFAGIPGKPEPQNGNGECFTLVFRGAKQLPQGTYTIEHSVLGTFKLLLVPSAKPGNAPQWDAVINRLHS